METSTKRPRNPFTQIAPSEREIIRRMMVQKKRIPEIAKFLGKHRSSVWREVKRNTNAGGVYYEVHAEGLLRRRRLQAREKFRVVENDMILEEFVAKLLKFGLSPEQIAGYMQRSKQVNLRLKCNGFSRGWTAIWRNFMCVLFFVDFGCLF